ncbi:MAG: pqiB [Myxococcaceae bacterium]|nr:pqiB [Myxococcaceae bacterium]
MSAAGPDTQVEESVPSAVQKHRARISPLWLVPLAAAGLVLYLGYQALASHGPTVTVTFKTAAGLSVEQTLVKHKSVTLGTVQGIELSKGEDHVIVSLSMDSRAESMLSEKTRFWVVRPRVEAGAVAALQTGLETLVSGSYIELDPGPSRGAAKHSFVGLEQPPAVRSGEPGTTFTLIADEIGPIGAGSSILHRQVPVGEVLDFDLDEKTGRVSIRAFVRAPYDRLVVEHTCFWNVSGLDVGMGASGLHVEVSSVRTLLSGGIAFQTPTEHQESKRVEPGHSFPLFKGEDAAEIALFGDTAPYVAYFDESVQGLAKGSPVKLFGMQVGNVTDLSLVLDPTDPERPHLVARVGLVLQPHRALEGPAADTLYPAHMREQVRQGLQIVLETSNYLTGEKALSLSYLPNVKTSAPREESGVLVLPSHAGGIDTLTDTLTEVATRLDSIPYEQIGKSLNHTLHSIDQAVSGPELQHAIAGLSSTLEEVHALAQEARTGLAPALQRLPAIAQHVDEAVQNANAALTNLGGSDGEFQQKAQRLLSQVADMARSVRLLADFLEHHPETLLRGRTPEVKK